MVVLTASAEGKLFKRSEPVERTDDLFWVGQDRDGVRLEACTRRVTGFELAVEDNGGIGEFLSWEAELQRIERIDITFGARDRYCWSGQRQSNQGSRSRRRQNCCQTEIRK